MPDSERKRVYPVNGHKLDFPWPVSPRDVEPEEARVLHESTPIAYVKVFNQLAAELCRDGEFCVRESVFSARVRDFYSDTSLAKEKFRKDMAKLRELLSFEWWVTDDVWDRRNDELQYRFRART